MASVTKSMFPVGTAYQHISAMKGRFDRLQGQLATGQRAANLAEMGSDRFFALSMRAKLSRLDGFKETMKTVGLRLEVMDQSVSRLSEIESTQRTSVTPGAYGTGNINFSTVPALAYARFDEVMTLLNADLGGRYLFAGGKTDAKPVISGAAAMNGEAGRDGYMTIMGERRQADIGAAGLGRVSVGTVTDTVSLTEDGAHPFGFKLSTLSTSSANVTLTQPTGVAPDTLAVQFTTGSLPLKGETVSVGLTLPDGTEEVIILTATDNPTPEPGEFTIGANGDTTAAAFDFALTKSLQLMAGTKLAAASAFAAAENFFNGRGAAVMRVDGPPFDTATALIAGTPANTVMWYAGEDASDPRATVNARVDEGTTVNYGVQANESGLVKLLQTLAAMAATIYPNGDDTAPGRFDAMASRQIERLSITNTNSQGSIGVIAVELSLAQTTMDYAGQRQSTHRIQLDGMLADIETIPAEEVSMEILSLKTRLEASFEVTSLISQLSLVHYLR